MLQKVERPLTEIERQRLSRSLVQQPGNLQALGWFSLWFVILVLCIFLFSKGLSRSGIWTAIVPFVFLGGVFSFYFAYLIASGHFHSLRQLRQFAREDAPQIRAALEDGQASVCMITSERAIVIEEHEDEGSVYLYDLGDGNSYFLRGEEYFPENEDAPWPAGRFEIVRTRRYGRLVGLFTGREAAPKIRTIPMGEMPESFFFSDQPQAETVIPGSPDEILKRWGHQGP